MNTYTLKKINEDGSIDVLFSIDKKVQNISGAPIYNADALKDFLSEYAVAYESGLKIEEESKKIVIDNAVKQTIETPALQVSTSEETGGASV